MDDQDSPHDDDDDGQYGEDYEDSEKEASPGSYSSEEEEKLDCHPSDDEDSDSEQDMHRDCRDALQIMTAHNSDLYKQMENTNDQPNLVRITSPYLTKFEKAMVLGIRASHIAKNAPLYVSIEGIPKDPLSIAEKELAEAKLPLIVRRMLPNGQFEDWRLNELKQAD